MSWQLASPTLTRKGCPHTTSFRAKPSRVAVITMQPGSESQQDAQRRGFDFLYTRAVLAKQP